MIILAADTCWQACSAALARVEQGDVTNLADGLEPMASGQAERLPALLAELFERSNVARDAVDRIAVPCGPGSFTGVRIALAMARAMRLATGADLVTCSSLELIAFGLDETARQAAGTRDILIAMDARRQQVYAQWFSGGRSLEKNSEPELVNVDQLAAQHQGRDIAVAGTGAEQVAEALGGAGGSAKILDRNPLPNARHMVRRASTWPPLTVPLQPLYLRPPDAKPPQKSSIARI